MTLYDWPTEEVRLWLRNEEYLYSLALNRIREDIDNGYDYFQQGETLKDIVWTHLIRGEDLYPRTDFTNGLLNHVIDALDWDSLVDTIKEDIDYEEEA